MPKKLHKYPLDQSPLYRLISRQRLAKLFSLSLHELEFLANRHGSENYRIFTLEAKNDPFSKPRKERNVQEPKEILADIHKQIFRYLGRISIPDYLHSATKDRSYITNADIHREQQRALKVDIKDFFPSITADKIYSFFFKMLQCSPDVSAILTKLTTFQGALPTGSPISPILSFFVYKDLFDELYQFGLDRNLKFTCYVDDLVFSGESVSASLGDQIASIVAKHGLQTHDRKTRFYRRGAVKIITGVALHNGKLLVPNDRFQRIRRLKCAIKTETDSHKKLSLLERFVGLLGEASQIEPRFRAWMVASSRELTLLRKNHHIQYKSSFRKKEAKWKRIARLNRLMRASSKHSQPI